AAGAGPGPRPAPRRRRPHPASVHARPGALRARPGAGDARARGGEAPRGLTPAACLAARLRAPSRGCGFVVVMTTTTLQGCGAGSELDLGGGDAALAPGRVDRRRDPEVLDRQAGRVEQRDLGVRRSPGCLARDHAAELGDLVAADDPGLDRRG